MWSEFVIRVIMTYSPSSYDTYFFGAEHIHSRDVTQSRFPACPDTAMDTACRVLPYSKIEIHLSRSHHVLNSLYGIYKQNVLISLRLSDSVQCRRGLYFQAWVLYLRFST